MTDLEIGLRCKNCGSYVSINKFKKTYDGKCNSCGEKITKTYDPFEWAWKDKKTGIVYTNVTYHPDFGITHHNLT